MKKLIALVLVLVMVLSLSTVAFAEMKTLIGDIVKAFGFEGVNDFIFKTVHNEAVQQKIFESISKYMNKLENVLGSFGTVLMKGLCKVVDGKKAMEITTRIVDSIYYVFSVSSLPN